MINIRIIVYINNKLLASLEILREREIAQQYKAAMLEWLNSEDAQLWENTLGDGLIDDEFTTMLIPLHREQRYGI